MPRHRRSAPDGRANNPLCSAPRVPCDRPDSSSCILRPWHSHPDGTTTRPPRAPDRHAPYRRRPRAGGRHSRRRMYSCRGGTLSARGSKVSRRDTMRYALSSGSPRTHGRSHRAYSRYRPDSIVHGRRIRCRAESSRNAAAPNPYRPASDACSLRVCRNAPSPWARAAGNRPSKTPRRPQPHRLCRTACRPARNERH
ncbi:hypothetical protein IMSAGC022_00909 [Alistipes sp.]|nr:hypothetical protein IMSAGC022_00909 [Alistipes sp.]